jgi:tRNA pseudouridine55 synthase
MYSALKREGRPLYELARRGETVEREPRPVEIERLEVHQAGVADLQVEVLCSKGTYVRVLGEEIAAGLGTVGHLTALRRLWVEPFEAGRLVTLDEIEATPPTVAEPDWLLPVDCAFPDLPATELDASQSLHLRQGRALPSPAGCSNTAGSLLRAYEAGGGFLGLVEVGTDGLLRVHRLFVAGAGSG